MGDGLFREEALAHRAGARAFGDVLRVPPAWARATFALLVLVAAAAFGFAALGSVTVYAHGLARVVARGGSTSVTVFFPERDRERVAAGSAMRLIDRSDPRRVLRGRLGSFAPEPLPLGAALARAGVPAWPTRPAPSRLAAGDGTLTPESGGAVPDVTDGEILEVEAPAGRESLLALLSRSPAAAR